MPQRHRSGVDVLPYNFFNLGARCGWVVNATTRPLYPRERPGTHCIVGWVGPRAGLDGCGKSRPHPQPEFDPYIKNNQNYNCSTTPEVGSSNLLRNAGTYLPSQKPVITLLSSWMVPTYETTRRHIPTSRQLILAVNAEYVLRTFRVTPELKEFQ